MSNYASISDFKIIGTISDKKEFSAWIASDPNSADSNDLLLINRFHQTPSNEEIFKEFFNYCSLESHSRDIVDFFASSDNFYIICKYYKGDNIDRVFDQSVNTANYDARCKVLNEILMKLSTFSELSNAALVCLSSMENICIDRDNKIQLIYNFEKILENENATKATIFNNISSILQLMLKKELKDRFSHALQIVLQKCDSNLYSSIPHLIVDLEKAEKKYLTSNFSTYLKRNIAKYKGKISKFSWVGGVAVLVCAAFIFGGKLFNGNSSISNAAVQVGNVKYNADEDSNNNEINPLQVTSRPETTDPLNLVLPANTNVPSEDYIVQYGDTLESICDTHYSSRDFVAAIESYNNNVSNAQLAAGCIIKLPDETAVKEALLY